MHHVLEAVIAIIAFLLVCVGLYYAWYSRSGWEPATYSSKGGLAGGGSETVPSWVPAKGRPVSSLRFRNAVFTMTDVTGKKHTKDVTTALNAMAAAYGGKLYDGAKPPPALALSGPINPFSFKIKGVNDRPAYERDPKTGLPLTKNGKINEAWARAQGQLPASLELEWRTVGGKF